MNAIEIRGLKKSFKGINALDGFDMTVPVGAIYGFIGENGSGKSTTEKLICGLLVPTGSILQTKTMAFNYRFICCRNFILSNRNDDCSFKCRNT